jgi:AraC family transcriptional regulator
VAEVNAQPAAESAVHFSRAFKATFGEAPAAFILKIKMVEARDILLRTRRPLAQVALDCGMSDQAHFSRTFRRIVGLTPSRFRQQQS